ncbi:g9350 [Coccomyxa elongata]
MEVFAALQVRALNLDLPGEALEAAVRLCAKSGQWQKAISILEQAHAQGSVSSPTTVAVFTTLLRESQPAAALRLLKDMEQRGTGNWEARGQCHNLVARTCARGRMLDEGLELLDNMYKAELHIQRDTYEALALGCLRAGRGERAEELFEERDYM